MSAIGADVDRELPDDPCSILDPALVETVLGVRQVYGDTMRPSYGCTYFDAAQVKSPGQVRGAIQTITVTQGEAAKRQQLEAYAQLLSRPGCIGAANPAGATPFPSEIEAMMALPLSDIYATWTKLFQERCVARSGGVPNDTSLGVGDSLDGFEFRSYRKLDGLGDVAVYYAVVRFGYDVSHVLDVVAGDRLYAFMVGGVPEFDQDNQLAFDAEVTLAQSILGERRVKLDVAIDPLGPLRVFPPVPPLPFHGGQPRLLPFDAIRSDMNYAEVAALLGFDGVAQPTAKEETWVWRQRHEQISVGFKDGVFSGSIFSNQVANSGFQTKVRQIALDMTDWEVGRILGPPSERRVRIFQPYAWTNANGGTITVNFEDGLSSGGWSM